MRSISRCIVAVRDPFSSDGRGASSNVMSAPAMKSTFLFPLRKCISTFVLNPRTRPISCFSSQTLAASYRKKDLLARYLSTGRLHNHVLLRRQFRPRLPAATAVRSATGPVRCASTTRLRRTSSSAGVRCAATSRALALSSPRPG